MLKKLLLTVALAATLTAASGAAWGATNFVYDVNVPVDKTAVEGLATVIAGDTASIQNSAATSTTVTSANFVTVYGGLGIGTDRSGGVIPPPVFGNAFTYNLTNAAGLTVGDGTFANAGTVWTSALVTVNMTGPLTVTANSAYWNGGTTNVYSGGIELFGSTVAGETGGIFSSTGTGAITIGDDITLIGGDAGGSTGPTLAVDGDGNTLTINVASGKTGNIVVTGPQASISSIGFAGGINRAIMAKDSDLFVEQDLRINGLTLTVKNYALTNATTPPETVASGNKNLILVRGHDDAMLIVTGTSTITGIDNLNYAVHQSNANFQGNVTVSKFGVIMSGSVAQPNDQIVLGTATVGSVAAKSANLILQDGGFLIGSTAVPLVISNASDSEKAPVVGTIKVGNSPLITEANRILGVVDATTVNMSVAGNLTFGTNDPLLMALDPGVTEGAITVAKYTQTAGQVQSNVLGAIVPATIELTTIANGIITGGDFDVDATFGTGLIVSGDGTYLREDIIPTVDHQGYVGQNVPGNFQTINVTDGNLVINYGGIYAADETNLATPSAGNFNDLVINAGGIFAADNDLLLGVTTINLAGDPINQDQQVLNKKYGMIFLVNDLVVNSAVLGNDLGVQNYGTIVSFGLPAGVVDNATKVVADSIEIHAGSFVKMDSSFFQAAYNNYIPFQGAGPNLVNGVILSALDAPGQGLYIDPNAVLARGMFHSYYGDYEMAVGVSGLRQVYGVTSYTWVDTASIAQNYIQMAKMGWDTGLLSGDYMYNNWQYVQDVLYGDTAAVDVTSATSWIQRIDNNNPADPNFLSGRLNLHIMDAVTNGYNYYTFDYANGSGAFMQGSIDRGMMELLNGGTVNNVNRVSMNAGLRSVRAMKDRSFNYSQAFNRALTYAGSTSGAASYINNCLLNRFWVGGIGMWDNADSRNSYSGYKYNAWGLETGYDRAFGPVIGSFAFSYLTGDYKDKAATAHDSKIDNYSFNLGFTYNHHSGFFGGVYGGYTYSDNDIKEMRGGNWATEDYNTKTWYVEGKLGYNIRPAKNFTLTPSIGLGYIDSRSSSHDVVYNNISLFNYNKVTNNTGYLPVEVRAAYDICMQNGNKLGLNATAGYTYNFRDDIASGQLMAKGLTGVIPVNTRGRNFGHSMWNLGAGAKYSFKERFDVGVNYEYLGASDFRSHQVYGTVGVRF